MAGTDESQRREFYRIRAHIPIRYRELRPGEFEVLRHEIENAREEPQLVDRALATRLDRLERKLDRMLALLDQDAPRPLDASDRRWVEISGSGLRLAAKDVPEVDRDVLLEFELPGAQVRRIRAIGRVVRSLEPDADRLDPELCLAFRVIREQDREEIVHYSHDVQRVQLRARRKREAAS